MRRTQRQKPVGANGMFIFQPLAEHTDRTKEGEGWGCLDLAHSYRLAELEPVAGNRLGSSELAENIHWLAG